MFSYIYLNVCIKGRKVTIICTIFSYFRITNWYKIIKQQFLLSNCMKVKNQKQIKCTKWWETEKSVGNGRTEVINQHPKSVGS